jgi:hypothetical protein
MFQFELLTKRDWVLVVVAAVLMLLIASGSLYWLIIRYTNA